MVEFDQKPNEDIYQYVDRITSLWHKEMKSAHKNYKTEDVLVKLFINGLDDGQVKRKMRGWFEQEKNPKMDEAEDLAYEYQIIETENILPDF